MCRDFKFKEGYIILHFLSLQKTLYKSILVLDNDPTVLCHSHHFCQIADILPLENQQDLVGEVS